MYREIFRVAMGGEKTGGVTEIAAEADIRCAAETTFDAIIDFRNQDRWLTSARCITARWRFPLIRKFRRESVRTLLALKAYAETLARLHVGQDAVQGTGDAGGSEGFGEEPGVADLAAGLGAEEALQLLLAGPVALGGLLAEDAERRQVAVRGDEGLDPAGAQRSDQLVFQVYDAHVEAEAFQVVAGQDGAEAAPGQAAPEVRLLALVAQAGQPGAQSARAEQCPMFVAPPIGTTNTPSRLRSRPRRAASAWIAAWSLTPSTRITAHDPGGAWRTADTAYIGQRLADFEPRAGGDPG